MWAGDLSNITDTSGSKYQLYDPFSTKADGTRTPFPDNIIPAEPDCDELRERHSEHHAHCPPAPAAIKSLGREQFPDFLSHQHQLQHPSGQNRPGIFGQRTSFPAAIPKPSRTMSQFGGRYGFPPIGTASGTGTLGQNVQCILDRRCTGPISSARPC